MNFTERLDEIEGRANAATEGPTLTRYDHGGGRLAVFHGDHRALVADFYGEGDREFYAAARSDVPALVAALRAVLAEHRPGNVYLLTDECGHDHDDDSDDRVGRDEWDDAFCLDSPTGETFCTGCIGSDEVNLPYPCLTVRAIASALDVTP